MGVGCLGNGPPVRCWYISSVVSQHKWFASTAYTWNITRVELSNEVHICDGKLHIKALGLPTSVPTVGSGSATANVPAYLLGHS